MKSKGPSFLDLSTHVLKVEIQNLRSTADYSMHEVGLMLHEQAIMETQGNQVTVVVR